MENKAPFDCLLSK